jgi:hypothetical protein
MGGHRPPATALARREARRKARLETAQKAASSSEPKRDRRKPTPKSLHIRADLAPGGSLHVRHHMSDRAFYDGEGITLSDDAAKDHDQPVWIQLAKTGSFLGHPAGPFELNERVFSEIIANFKATKNLAIPIDYEHASEQDPTSGNIPVAGAPAQGWIRDLKIQDGNLWGFVDWLPQARDQIRARQYKFISPAVRFGAKDRVTGKPIGARLTSAGLTNEPFLDGMQPLAAKDAATVREAAGAHVVAMGAMGLDRTLRQPHEYLPQLKTALRMGPLCSAAECSDELARLRACCEMSDANGYHEGVNLHDYMNPLAEMVGMTGPQHSWGNILDVVEDMIDAAMEKHIAQDHGGQASMADRPADTHQEDTMSDAQTIALKDAQDKVTLLTVKVTELGTRVATLETDNSKLQLTLKDVTGRAETAETTLKGVMGLVTLKDKETLEQAVARIVEESKRLLDDKTKRDEADLKGDVEIAFATYKDAKQLTDKDKEAMTRVARADREAFNQLYPPVSPENRHLLREVTPPEPRELAEKSQSFSGRTKQIMAERGCSLAEAQNLASAELRGGG